MFPLHDNIPLKRTPLITWGLIIANAVFFLEELYYGQDFIYQYALIPSHSSFTSLEGILPFFTSMFLHGGWFHLLSNLWFLRIFGDNVESYFGKIRYLAFYIIAGGGASFIQYLFGMNSTTPMLGASGAIAGVLGAYLVFFPKAKITSLFPIFFYITFIDIPAAFYLPYWFIIQFFSGVGQIASGTLATSGGVAFFAHAGGFAIGYIAARFYRR